MRTVFKDGTLTNYNSSHNKSHQHNFDVKFGSHTVYLDVMLQLGDYMIRTQLFKSGSNFTQG